MNNKKLITYNVVDCFILSILNTRLRLIYFKENIKDITLDHEYDFFVRYFSEHKGSDNIIL